MRQLIGVRRTKAGAVLAAVVMLAALVLMAGPSRGATEATQAFATGKVGPAMIVTGNVPGQATPIKGSAGLLEISLEGKTTWAYCIEVMQHLLTGSNQLMNASPWSSANVPNLPNIQRILNQHPADATIARAQTDASGANQEAGAVQAAIWHFSDGFDLTKAVTRDAAQTDQTAAVKALYDQIVADASAHPVGEPKTSLEITPATASAPAGQEVGPFTVATTATSPLALAVSGGTAEIRDCTTHAVKTTAVDGDKICLFRATEGGPVTLTASGEAPVDAGRVFINVTDPNSQEIILAGTKSVPVEATVQASWSAVSGTTTTTAPTTTTTAPGSTTTTTAPATTTTTVAVTVLAEQTPPQQAQAATPSTPAQTPAATPAANSSLPFTGANALTIAAIAFALLSIGTFVVGTTLPAKQQIRRKRG